MELDDLKNAWSQYDKKLSENLRINEELLRKMNINSSKRELQKILNYELISIVLLVLLISFVFFISFRFLDQLQFSIPGFITIAVSLIYLAFGIDRIKGLLNIDYYGSPVVKVQREFLSLKRKVLRFRKYELILMPVYLLPLLPLLFKFMYDIDIYKNMRLLVFEVIIVLGLGYPLVIWIYKYFYGKKIRNAENLLLDLDKFEDEA